MQTRKELEPIVLINDNDPQDDSSKKESAIQQKEQKTLQQLQKRSEALRQELQKRYPNFNWKTLDIPGTDLDTMRDNVDYLIQRLTCYLVKESEEFLKYISPIDADYAQASSEKLVKAQNNGKSISQLIQVRDELAVKHKELELAAKSRFETVPEVAFVPAATAEPLDVLPKLEKLDQKYVKRLSALIDDLGTIDLYHPDLLQFNIDMGRKLKNPLTPEELEATGKLIISTHEHYVKVIRSNCQDLIQELNTELGPQRSTNDMQLELNNAQTIAELSKIETQLGAFGPKLAENRAGRISMDLARQECLNLLQIIKKEYLSLKDPQGAIYCESKRKCLQNETVLHNFKAHKKELEDVLSTVKIKVKDKEQVKKIVKEIKPYLDKIKAYYPGGPQGSGFCFRVETSLQTATLEQARNELIEVRKFCAKNEKIHSEQVSACKQLIANIRVAQKSSVEQCIIPQENNLLSLPIYELQNLIGELTRYSNDLPQQKSKHINDPLKLECRQLMTMISKNNSGRDHNLKLFLQEEVKKVNNSTSQTELKQIKSNLIALLNDPATRIINKIIRDLRNDSGFWSFFSIGKEAKARNIETALIDVPVTERANILTSNAGLKVRKELARHRYGCFEGDVVHKINKQVDVHKAADSFKFFRNEMIKEAAKSAPAKPAPRR